MQTDGPTVDVRLQEQRAVEIYAARVHHAAAIREIRYVVTHMGSAHKKGTSAVQGIAI